MHVCIYESVNNNTNISSLVISVNGNYSHSENAPNYQ